jgi:hypothetical protein
VAVGDVVVLALFLALAFSVQAGFVVHGQPWVDAALFFHFGHKFVSTGAVPFRDYIFQVGPLPVYVDALFQAIFGATYVSSLWAALTIKSSLAFVIHLFARRWVGRAAGVLLGVFLLLDPVFCFQHHWSTTYALLFALLSAFFFARAYERPLQKAQALALSGFFVACIFTCRQSGAVVASVALAVVTGMLAFRCPEFMDRRSLARLWGGYCAALLLFVVVLAAQGALVVTVQQLLLDAPAKKSVMNVDTFLDVVSGGGLLETGAPFTRLTGFLYYNGVPIVLAVVILLGLWRRPRERGGALLLAALPIGVALGRIAWPIGVLDDFPRVFGLLTLILVLLAPRTSERMLGIPAPVAAIVLALPLSLEMALEASYRGRGWVDSSSMIALCLLVGLRTRRIAKLEKTVLCAAFAAIGILNTAWMAHRDLSPFVKDDMSEGTLSETRFASDAPAAAGMYMDESKYRVTTWLRERVRSGDTCFVYGSSAMLYDLLDCRNPSALDVTISEFFSVKDGERVVRQLRNAPPRWIIAAESHWTNPDLATPYAGNDQLYWGGPNGGAAKVLHIGVQSILGDYEVVGETSEALPPELLAQAERHPEKPHRFRLYRRRDRDRDRDRDVVD